ncbi:AAA family ATPase [Megasphaera sp. ASD88]|mgnify:CR=1 FL=1|uniref:AAA family ATPase n=1 Tax=Megasphaera sp. ASD88 TaxID=2027407 RepID=UPI0018E92702|nr:AAA family ATPase [Megasphaera sp. ASD88]
MNKAMPIGADDFKEVREKYYFVDKTDFIRQLIDGHSKVTLITRPRRFGKTLTMSMLEYFFSIDREKDSQTLFQGLAIDWAGKDYMKHQNKYPVIFMTLKGVQNNTWISTYKSFRLFVQKEFQKHDYVLQGDRLKPSEKEFYQRIMNLTADEEEYQVSLLNLSAYLYRYFGVKPIILIDEYDAPIQCAYEYGFYDTAILYFKGWFNNTLKSNENLNFAVLTGVLRIAKESIFSGLNNLDVCSVLRDKYSDVFGFTSEEVAKLAEDVEKPDVLPELKKWYDGYRFGSSEIYNPLSVVSYIDNQCLPKPYWMNTSNNAILRELLSHADYLRIKALRGLLHDVPVSASLNEGVIYDQIGSDQSALYTMLLTTGYLTVAEDVPTSYDRYLLRIPNEEIKRVYGMEILNTIAEGMDRDTFDGLFDLLFTGQSEDFAYQLQKILLRFASTYDTANKESFYHGFMLGMSALFLGKDYMVESNRESGYGRFDIAIFPKDETKAGVLMEFKAADKDSELEKTSKEALAQIEERQYDVEFSKRGIGKVWKYGIAFCGKHVCVKIK